MTKQIFINLVVSWTIKENIDKLNENNEEE